MQLCFRELSADALLDLDIFNLSADKTSKKTGEVKGKEGEGGEDEEAEEEDCSALFWQPGKRGFYSPRQGRLSPDRLNAFRNVGR